MVELPPLRLMPPRLRTSAQRMARLVPSESVVRESEGRVGDAEHEADVVQALEPGVAEAQVELAKRGPEVKLSDEPGPEIAPDF